MHGTHGKIAINESNYNKDFMLTTLSTYVDWPVQLCQFSVTSISYNVQEDSYRFFVVTADSLSQSVSTFFIFDSFVWYCNSYPNKFCNLVCFR